MLHEKSRVNANWWLFGQCVRLIPAKIVDWFFWKMVMFNNYGKSSIRNMQRYKAYTLLNISGLAIGLASFILIFLWVQDEISYDRFHEKSDDIYRVISYTENPNSTVLEAGTASPLGQALKSDFPEVIDFVRVFPVDKQIVSAGDQVYKEDRFAFVESSFLDMFSFPLIMGDRESALSDMHSVLISPKMSEKYFGDSSPIGQVLTFETWGDLKVTGIIDIPSNSHMKFDMFASFDRLNQSNFPLSGWWWTGFYTYLLLDKEADWLSVAEKIAPVHEAHEENSHVRLDLQPLKDIHLHSTMIAFDNVNINKGNILYVRIFLGLAFVILAIACINFANLTTSRCENRSLEVGLRKVIGAQRRQIVHQFLGESLLVVGVAFVLSLFILALVLPSFEHFTGKSVQLLSNWNSQSFLYFLIIITMTALITGFYPSAIFSGFQPATVLKRKNRQGNRSMGFRRALVILQFSISIFLIIGSLMISKQLSFIRSKDLGFRRDSILVVEPSRRFRQFGVFKGALLKNPMIHQVTGSMPSPISVGSWVTDNIDWEGKTDDLKISVAPIFVGYDFFKTFEIQIIQGRGFDPQFSTDEPASFILNERAVRQMGLAQPVGKTIVLDDQPGQIVGVAKDFHHQSLHHQIDPLVMRLAPNVCESIFVRVDSRSGGDTIDYIHQTWKELVPDYPLQYSFLAEGLQKQYASETRLFQLFGVFTALAIFISCLGLLGLSALLAERRTKEIGIRKVLGATTKRLVVLLNKEFVVLVAMANAIAWPAAYFVLREWLTQFAFRTHIDIVLFLIAGIGGICIALVTVSFQAIKAAMADPVKTIRYE